MRNLLLSALLFACGAFHAPQTIASARAAETTRQSPATPEVVARGFYTWYTGRLNRNDFDPLRNRRAALRYLTPEFYRRAPRLIRQLNADIFICAQDWLPEWSKNIEISTAVVRGAKATTNVTMNVGGTDKIRIRVELRRVRGEWKIDGSNCVE